MGEAAAPPPPPQRYGRSAAVWFRSTTCTCVLMETFERLGETVQLCNVYWPLEDFDKTDEIVTQLYLIIDEVEALIPILRDERSPDLNTLIELLAALFQLLALWEAKLATLDGSRAHHHVNRQGLGPGRRRKYINVELVRTYVRVSRTHRSCCVSIEEASCMHTKLETW